MRKAKQKKIASAIAINAIAMINHAQNATVIAIVMIVIAQNPIIPAANKKISKRES